VHSRRPLNGIVLDMDSSVSPTYGDQEGTAYNVFLNMQTLKREKQEASGKEVILERIL